MDGSPKLATECIGDEDRGDIDRFGMVEQDPDVRLKLAVGQQNDGVARCESEEFVGEGGPSVHKRGAGFADPLSDDLAVGGEMRGGSDASPDDAVSRGEDGDGVLERLRRDVAGEAFDAGEVIADHPGKELVARRFVEGAPEALSEGRVVAIGGEGSSKFAEAAVAE